MRDKFHSQVDRSNFQISLQGKKTDLFYLRNSRGTEMSVTNFGARVVELWFRDKRGEYSDIVLGHDRIDEYVNYSGERFLGAAIGRFANRIAKGAFSIDGKNYELPINDGPNSLHGGNKGFDMVVWDVVQPSERILNFSYLSKDGEEGFPGNLLVKMSYELTEDDEFIIRYDAVTDKKTIINLTHHSFFNLHGAGNGTINDHLLMINADRFTPINDVMIPKGELADVEGTPFDFRKAVAIGERIGADSEQLTNGHGYDHNWVLNRKTPDSLELAAAVYEPVSGRSMKVWTTQPGIQFYGGNFFNGMVGKHGIHYNKRESFALETQHFPDSPNHPSFPSTVLCPGEEYRQVCIYKFDIIS